MTVGAAAVRVVDRLVDALADRGVRYVFGVDGANIEDVYDALALTAAPIAGIVAKHEFAAATMADGAARSTGGLGVVAATSGGGALNLVAGLGEASASRVPVLALVGQPPTTLEGRGAFQDSSGRSGTIDAVTLFAQVSRYCARVERPEDLDGHLSRAVSAATAGGPAVLLLPKDVQQAAADPWSPGSIAPTAAVDAPDIGALAAVLDRARRRGKIVIVAGDEVARAGARAELADLVRVLDASVGVAPDAKDVVDPDTRGYCGVVGVMGHPELVDAVRCSELCLLVGTRMPVLARVGPDELLRRVTVVSLGHAPPYLPSTHTGTGDLRAALRALVDAFAPVPAVSSNRDVHRPTAVAVPPAHGPGLRYRDAAAVLDRHLPDGVDVFVDAGNTGAAIVHHLPVRRGGRFVVALGMGGMGYAFGAGIGSAFVRGRRTVVIAGDGAFFMHGMEMHTAVQHALPVTFVVFNNNAHGMCVTRERLLYSDRYSFNRFESSHLSAGVAAMFPSVPAYVTGTVAELDAALSAVAEVPGPVFVEVLCDPDEIPPFLPFLPPAEADRSDTHDSGGTP